jgi:hypothetical protein
MFTLFESPNLSTYTGNVNSCSRPSVLKLAVVAAAAELLCLAGESVGGLVLLSGNDKETLTAISKLKDYASRARSSAAVKAVSVTDLSDFKLFAKDPVRHRAQHHQRRAPLRRGRVENYRKQPAGSPLPPFRGCELPGRCERTAL